MVTLYFAIALGMLIFLFATDIRSFKDGGGIAVAIAMSLLWPILVILSLGSMLFLSIALRGK